MTRGKQKIEAQKRNAEKNQKAKGSQFEARAVALKVTCPICKVSSLRRPRSASINYSYCYIWDYLWWILEKKEVELCTKWKKMIIIFLSLLPPPTQSLVPQLLPLSLACLRKEIMLGTQLLAQFCATTRHMGSCGWYILLPITTHHMASCDTEWCKKLCP